MKPKGHFEINWPLKNVQKHANVRKVCPLSQISHKLNIWLFWAKSNQKITWAKYFWNVLKDCSLSENFSGEVRIKGKTQIQVLANHSWILRNLFCKDFSLLLMKALKSFWFWYKIGWDYWFWITVCLFRLRISCWLPAIFPVPVLFRFLNLKRVLFS